MSSFCFAMFKKGTITIGSAAVLRASLNLLQMAFLLVRGLFQLQLIQSERNILSIPRAHGITG